MNLSLYAILALLVATTACALRVGVFVFPEMGHLNPMLTMMSELVVRGHAVDLYMPDIEQKGFDPCPELPVVQTDLTGVFRCVHYKSRYDPSHLTEEWMQTLAVAPILKTFTMIDEEASDAYNLSVDGVVEAMKQEPRPDVMLIDAATEYALIPADLMNVPVVVLWPLTLSFPMQTNPAIPGLATGLRINMTITQRLVNFLIQRLSIAGGAAKQMLFTNVQRARFGLPPAESGDLFTRRLVITPSVFGLDMAHPLCPNVVPVGFLLPPISKSEVVPPDWDSWMKNDCDSIIYWNMGSVAVLPEEWARRFESAIVSFRDMSRMCHIWKLSAKPQKILRDETMKMRNVRIIARIPFSPRLLLSNPKTTVFVTHCGDTSVYETIDAGVPVVGIPLFADQPDMCARVADANIGIALDKFTFTAESLAASVEKVAHSSEMRANMQRLRTTGYLLGGAPRAADYIELVGRVGVSPFVCRFLDLPLYQRWDLDVIGLTSLTLFFIFWMVLACCKGIFRCFERRQKPKRKPKAE